MERTLTITTLAQTAAALRRFAQRFGRHLVLLKRCYSNFRDLHEVSRGGLV